MFRLKHRFPAEQDESTSLRSLMLLDKLNPAPSPVWYADQGAIVEMLNGKRAVKLPEVVS